MTHPDGGDADNQRDNVGQHVIRVADQCQRVRYVTKDKFDQEKRKRQRQHAQQPTSLRLVPRHCDNSRQTQTNISTRVTSQDTVMTAGKEQEND